MNSKRSYLENLNAGRQRRSGTALDEISRTLDQLETRLERALDPRERRAEEESDIARRMERLSDQAGMRRVPGDRPASRAGYSTPRATLERIAREIEDTRRREDQLASIGGIAAELQGLREDMRGLVNAGLRREFDAMREELVRVTDAAPYSPLAGELNAEFERLSDAIERLASRNDDQSTKMLRLELEQVKASLANLAREETVRSLDRRWDAFESRFSGQQGSDPAIERLGARLEEISAAVNSLPESLSLASLDERVRALAGALDNFAEQHEKTQPDLYAMVEERLDEISRAITASAALASSPSFDRTLLERIEARIASLANQLNEVVQDRPDGLLVERLNALSERVDQIAERVDVPEKVVERLAGHITRIAEKLETVPSRREADDVFRSLEDRFVHLSELIERRQDDAIQQGQSLFHDLERRLHEVVDRLDRTDPAEKGAGIMAAIDSRFSELSARIERSREDAGDAAMQALEARLEDISLRLQNSASAHAGLDSELIRNLEIQVASLAEHLSKPVAHVPDFEDLGPRLEQIERSIGENRAAVLEAAREAAAEAVEKLAGAPAEPFDNGLRRELQNLEALTRRSDERNTKTFEAIHDTLLKIVDRLGSLEETGAGKIAPGSAPSLAPMAGYPDEDEIEMAAPAGTKRTPAEAAAAAAEAALMDDADARPVKQEPRKVLASLSRAFASRRTDPERVEREEPVLAGESENGMPVVDADHVEVSVEQQRPTAP
jgi:localization factor PodJL